MTTTVDLQSTNNLINTALTYKSDLYNYLTYKYSLLSSEDKDDIIQEVFLVILKMSKTKIIELSRVKHLMLSIGWRIAKYSLFKSSKYNFIRLDQMVNDEGEHIETGLEGVTYNYGDVNIDLELIKNKNTTITTVDTRNKGKMIIESGSHGTVNHPSLSSVIRLNKISPQKLYELLKTNEEYRGKTYRYA